MDSLDRVVGAMQEGMFNRAAERYRGGLFNLCRAQHETSLLKQVQSEMSLGKVSWCCLHWNSLFLSIPMTKSGWDIITRPRGSDGGGQTQWGKRRWGQRQVGTSQFVKGGRSNLPCCLCFINGRRSGLGLTAVRVVMQLGNFKDEKMRVHPSSIHVCTNACNPESCTGRVEMREMVRRAPSA